jgi:ribosomal protein S18 acetylase RimI-like enzyme
MTPVRIVTLGAADVSAYRELMLEAYEQAADAFTTTAAERALQPESWWVQRIGSATGCTTAFGAWQGRTLVGSVALEYSAKPKTRHAATVLGLYVRPAARGQRVGRALMETALSAAQARAGVRLVELTLTEGNTAALQLYRSLGFQAWGTAPMAILTAAGFRGKVHMTRLLPPWGPTHGAPGGAA